MKKFLILYLTPIFLLLFVSGVTFSAGNLKWYSFNEGMQKAKAQNRQMIVDFYADWCSWCKVMDEKTFSDKTIKQILARDYILVRIDTEKNQTINFDGSTFTTREFQAYMRVTGLPTLAFFDAKGKPITLLPGYVTAEQLKPILGYISSECYSKDVSFDQYVSANEKCEK